MDAFIFCFISCFLSFPLEKKIKNNPNKEQKGNPTQPIIELGPADYLLDF
tara:strand:+ start:25549 stop:25698 length:150 start_codon:yes stop_codon:yes gene_type:complete